MSRIRRRGTTLPEVAIGAGLTTLVAALAFAGLGEVVGTQERVSGRVVRQESLRRLGAYLRADLARMVPEQVRISTSGRTLAMKIQRPAPPTEDPEAPLTETVTLLYAWDPAEDGGLELTRRLRGPAGWEGPAEPVPLVAGALGARFLLVDGARGWLEVQVELGDEGEGELTAALPRG